MARPMLCHPGLSRTCDDAGVLTPKTKSLGEHGRREAPPLLLLLLLHHVVFFVFFISLSDEGRPRRHRRDIQVRSNMDPITALGAAGTVIGIVGFGMQLSQVHYEFGSQVGSAQQSLRDVLDAIDATTRALNEIHTYLEAEEQNVKDGNHLRLFSQKSLLGVKEPADKCLVVFKRIEGTIVNTSQSKQEDALVAKLMAFNKSLQTGEKPALVLDSKLKSLSLNFVDRLRWTYVAPKLEDYSRQLHHYQLSLVLMFSVISLGEQRMKP